MSAMDCSEFLDHINEWVEGQEVPGARDHSRSCAHCRGLAEDLCTIRLTASTAFELDEAPSERVWTALRTQLQQEGIIRGGKVRTGSSWFDSLFAVLPRPALAGAYVALLVAAGFALSGPAVVPGHEDQWRERTQVSTSQLSAQLQDAEQNAVASLASFNPVVTEDLRKNLTIVDNDIALCEKSVREAPESEIARDYLYSAYQQKADLLAQISEHGVDTR